MEDYGSTLVGAVSGFALGVFSEHFKKLVGWRFNLGAARHDIYRQIAANIALRDASGLVTSGLRSLHQIGTVAYRAPSGKLSVLDVYEMLEDGGMKVEGSKALYSMANYIENSAKSGVIDGELMEYYKLSESHKYIMTVSSPFADDPMALPRNMPSQYWLRYSDRVKAYGRILAWAGGLALFFWYASCG